MSKITIIFIAIFVTFSIASCGDLTTTSTGGPTTEEVTTALETTVAIVTTQETTTEATTTIAPTTTEATTTIAPTTTEVVTTVPITTTATTTIVTDFNLTNYYLSAINLVESDLFLQLRTIINNGFHGVTYGNARYILDETDADPNNPDNVILVYTQWSVDETWDSGLTWNREHVWPQSLLPNSADNYTVNTASDLQNLKPADRGSNSSRSNKYFVNTTTTLSYAPPNEVKGDIARILFYMVVMYDELSLVDTTPNKLEMRM